LLFSLEKNASEGGLDVQLRAVDDGEFKQEVMKMKRMQRWICVLCVGGLLGSVMTTGADLLGIDVDISGDVMTVSLDQDGNGSEDLVVTGMEMGRVRVVDPLYIKNDTGTIAPVSAALQPTATGARAALLDGKIIKARSMTLSMA
jgi:hypothetical protein